MNVLGHARVALDLGLDGPAEVLGAVLPDLAPAAGVRLVRDRLDGPLAAGVRCHLDADAAFHAHPRFRAGTRALRADLTARGIPRGPARAVAHAGWELLLDGTLVGDEAERAFRAAVGRAAVAAGALAPEDRPRWAAFVARARGSGPLAYDDPRWVAVRLGTVLARRPRLRLPAEHVDAVAPVLAAHRAEVARVAGAVIDDVVRAVSHGERRLTGDRRSVGGNGAGVV